MQDRPSADELLEAVAGFLRDDVMPATSGRVNFHARVAANVLDMLRRELAHEEDHLRAEWAGLQALLDDASQPESPAELRRYVREGNRALSERIRSGLGDEGPWRAAALAHLEWGLRAKLEVSNPGWLGEG